MTGHTGFMGGWLVTWLHHLGATVGGLALPPGTTPSFYEAVRVRELLGQEVVADVRDLQTVTDAVSAWKPEVVFHLAAQPIVSEAFQHPIDTFQTNILGTANVLEAVRVTKAARAVLVVTSDKVYETNKNGDGHHEDDRLGATEPYAASKVCAEVVSNCYRQTYLSDTAIRLTTIRAGNIVGGGDWAPRRLIPDLVRAFSLGNPAAVRSPHSVRPWQHVTEPVRGFLMLAEKLWQATDEAFDGAWNFGPHPDDHKSVAWIAERCARLWGLDAKWQVQPDEKLAERPHLAIASRKAGELLEWFPSLDLDAALVKTIVWYKSYLANNDVRGLSLTQIEQACSTAKKSLAS